MLKNIGIDAQELMKMYGDNKAIVKLSNSPALHDWRKHMEVNQHFIWEKIDENKLVLSYVNM